jgi:actin-related protein
MFINKSASLSAIASARSTAMVLDSGYGYTYFVPVHEGFILDKAMMKF